MNGVFITIEGPEGAGKTTLIKALAERLRGDLAVPLTLSREPGGNPIAEEIRQVILNKAFTNMDGRTEALLYAAARRQHLVDNILPKLAQGHLILCDRFVDSSIAYQGYGRHLGASEVLAINQFATDGLSADLTIYIDIDVAVGLERIHRQRQGEINRLDLEKLDFHERVRQGYLQIAQDNPDRVVTLDGTLSNQALTDQCLALLHHKFPKLFKSEVDK